MNPKKTKKAKIFIIDDEESIRDSCTQVLTKDGYEVQTSSDGREAVNILNKSRFDIILLDLKLPGIPGIKILKKIIKSTPEIPVIIITGFASIESAVNTIKQGAFDYLAKPFSPEELRTIVKKALNTIETQAAYEKNKAFKQNISMVVGKSTSMEKVIDIMKRVSPTESTVLITGESGTGKELLASEIHKHSKRKRAPFVVVDCGALVETLFESELFGHVKGSFTGAHVTKHGRFEVADGGTIFLDEISNISMNIQANQKYNQKLSKDIKGFTTEAKKAIMDYDWPGNIRELQNTIERAMVLMRSKKIGLDDLIYHGIGTSRSMIYPTGGNQKTLDEIEKEYIESVLKSQHGNKSKTAKILGIDRKTLYSKIEKYKIR